MAKLPFAYANVHIAFAGTMISSTAKLYPTRRDRRPQSELKLGCPIHAAEGTAAEVGQRYVCKTDGHDGALFTEAECAKIAAQGKEFVVVGSAAEITAAKATGDPDASLELRSVPAADVERLTRHSGAEYFVGPDKDKKGNIVAASAKVVASIVRALSQGPDVALVGEITLRGVTKLVRLEPEGGQLVMRELTRVGEAVHLDEPLADVEVPVAEIEVLRAFLAQTSPFNEQSYPDRQLDALDAFVAERIEQGGVKVTAARVEATASILSFTAALAGNVAKAEVKPKRTRKPKAS